MDLLQRDHAAAVGAALAKYPPERAASAVLEVLYLAQAAYGRITEDAVEEVAGLVGLPATHVRALVGFYTLFLEEPHGHFVVHYCNDLPCALRGADAFLETVCETLGCRPGETSADGVFTLDTVMCLAACDKAPIMQVNLEYCESLTAESVAALAADLRARAAAGGPARPPFGLGPPSEMAHRAAPAADPVAAPAASPAKRPRRKARTDNGDTP